ncbi:uncharacterized protein LOC142645782 [Dermatophagoides pteronyssinus]|uniref:uncharacterized protein LOC142645782 n=1 Tax=Dermatophagoides pteronyssinus TaxID=6956 RepID=UPI003F677A36
MMLPNNLLSFIIIIIVYSFVLSILATFIPSLSYQRPISPYYYSTGPRIYPTYCPPTTTIITQPSLSYLYRIKSIPVYSPLVYTSLPYRSYYNTWKPASYFWRIRSQNGTNTTDYIYKSKWYSPTFWKYQGSIQHFPLSNETNMGDDGDTMTKDSLEKESEPLMMMKEKRANEIDQLEKEEPEPLANEKKMESKNEKQQQQQKLSAKKKMKKKSKKIVRDVEPTTTTIPKTKKRKRSNRMT